MVIQSHILASVISNLERLLSTKEGVACVCTPGSGVTYIWDWRPWALAECWLGMKGLTRKQAGKRTMLFTLRRMRLLTPVHHTLLSVAPCACGDSAYSKESVSKLKLWNLRFKIEAAFTVFIQYDSYCGLVSLSLTDAKNICCWKFGKDVFIPQL